MLGEVRGMWPRTLGAAGREAEATRLERELRMLVLEHEALKREHAAQSRLMTGVDERLRQQTNALSNWTAYLAGQGGDGLPRKLMEGVENVRLIARETAELSRRITEQMDPQGQAASVVTGPVELIAVLAGVIAALGPLARREGVTMHGPAASVGRVVVLGDAGRIERIIEALLDNALRFTPAGGQVAIGLETAGDRAVMVFQDTGPGVPPQVRAGLFEPFSAGPVNGVSPGLGLGLSSARRSARSMNGDLLFAAGSTRGARFILDLPAPSKVAATNWPHSEPLHNKTILVVESEEADRRLMCRFLSEARAMPFGVATAGRALDAARELRPDVILATMELADGDGFALKRALEATPACAHTPVVALTCSGSSQMRARGDAVGFAGWEVKPTDLKAVKAALEAALGRRTPLSVTGS